MIGSNFLNDDCLCISHLLYKGNSNYSLGIYFLFDMLNLDQIGVDQTHQKIRKQRLQIITSILFNYIGTTYLSIHVVNAYYHYFQMDIISVQWTKMIS
ncbi:unnamed protein product [Paramecium octaurelia]|uniref:Transmembrane protein n=1 Tax=Paramecium octaurelia TaxID=43137 RepID=A0A8S1SS40_PAROT|nr:unnamed protein product [Paramecium octaurelia]